MTKHTFVNSIKEKNNIVIYTTNGAQSHLIIIHNSQSSQVDSKIYDKKNFFLKLKIS